MSRFFNITFPFGLTYQVPAQIITDNIVASFLENHPDLTAEGAQTEAAKYDTSDLIDWAKNNMSWDELAPHARLVAAEPVNHIESYGDATIDGSDTMRPLFVLSDEQTHNVAAFSVEALMTTLLSTGSAFSGIVLSHATQPHQVVLAAIQGHPQVVDTYLKTLNQLGEALSKIVAEQREQVQQQIADQGASEPAAATDDAPSAA